MLPRPPDLHSSFGTVKICYVSNNTSKSSVNTKSSNNPSAYRSTTFVDQLRNCQCFTLSGMYRMTLLHVTDWGRGGFVKRHDCALFQCSDNSNDLQDWGKIRNRRTAGLGTNILTRYLTTQRLIFTRQFEARVSWL
jgi:hypothetical protein